MGSDLETRRAAGERPESGHVRKGKGSVRVPRGEAEAKKEDSGMAVT